MAPSILLFAVCWENTWFCVMVFTYRLKSNCVEWFDAVAECFSNELLILDCLSSSVEFELDELTFEPCFILFFSELMCLYLSALLLLLPSFSFSALIILLFSFNASLLLSFEFIPRLEGVILVPFLLKNAWDCIFWIEGGCLFVVAS